MANNPITAPFDPRLNNGDRRLGADAHGPTIRRPEPPMEPTSDDLTFSGRYPNLCELVEKGGLPGVVYGLVPGELQVRMQRYGWSPIENMPPISIEGPRGRVDTVLVMGHGQPIPGAPAGNGKRRFMIHYQLEEKTGLFVDPSGHLQNIGYTTEADVEGVKPKSQASQTQPLKKETKSDEAQRPSQS